MQVEGHQEGSLLPLLATGARVRNAYPTIPLPGDSPAKAGLIPDIMPLPHDSGMKGFPAWDGDASD